MVNVKTFVALFIVQLQTAISAYLCANDNYTLHDADTTYCSNPDKISVAYKHLVMYSNTLYQCQWWTQGDIPGENIVWLSKKQCESNPDDICAKYNDKYSYTIYDSTKKYCESGLQYVKYDNSIYMCVYWTQGQNPSEHETWLLIHSLPHHFLPLIKLSTLHYTQIFSY
eukprot:393398_1